uniref:Carboxylesterase type B domain-containing protein n=1 Tax=Tetranychus urticae TaxID=32264 RepID=T1JZ62_TETUR
MIKTFSRLLDSFLGTHKIHNNLINLNCTRRQPFNTTITSGDDYNCIKLSFSSYSSFVCKLFELIDVYQFLGIPYAKPPIDKLRLQLAVKPDPWTEVKSVADPDCLYLNIYVTESTFNKSSVKQRPVLFWIHNGGLTTRSGVIGGLPMLSLHDVLLVYINYRLNAFGFIHFAAEETRIPTYIGLKLYFGSETNNSDSSSTDTQDNSLLIDILFIKLTKAPLTILLLNFFFVYSFQLAPNYHTNTNATHNQYRSNGKTKRKNWKPYASSTKETIRFEHKRDHTLRAQSEGPIKRKKIKP